MAADQVTAVRHRLLHSQYLAMAARTDFAVEVIQQLAEAMDFDLPRIEAHINETMAGLTDSLQRKLDAEMFHGGGPGGGKSADLRDFKMRFNAQVQPQRGIVLTCVA